MLHYWKPKRYHINCGRSYGSNMFPILINLYYIVDIYKFIIIDHINQLSLRIKWGIKTGLQYVCRKLTIIDEKEALEDVKHFYGLFMILKLSHKPQRKNVPQKYHSTWL